MGFLNNIFNHKKGKKVFVLGLDGVPFTFMDRIIKEGKMPVFKSLLDKGEFKRMNSVLPTISSVAWSSFMTGKDAAGHNIYGFVDREANPFKLFIPTSRKMKASTIWHELSEMGKRSIVMNVPVTYPPDKINGIIVSGFLATNINKAAYPQEIVEELKALDYIIDADTWIARDSKDKFMDELYHVLERRFKTMFKFIKEKEWDYFQCHIMETDRINHFYWTDMEEKNEYAELFYKFYQKIDEYIKQLLEILDDEIELIILSDHGFCSINKEVEVNKWLEDRGYLKYRVEAPESVADMAGESKAYSLLPGRIFINRSGREELGTVDAREYFDLREEIKEGFLVLKDEDSGQKIIKDVFFREELYNGPYLEQAADIIIVPEEGYDLKGGVGRENLMEKRFIQGMHTYDDAFIYMKKIGEEDSLKEIEEIKDVKKIIIDKFRG